MLELDKALLERLRAATRSEDRPEWMRTHFELMGFGMVARQHRKSEGGHPAVLYNVEEDGRTRDWHSFIRPEWREESPDACCKHIVTILVRDARKCLRPIQCGGKGFYGYRKNKRKHVEYVEDEQSVVSIPDEAVTTLVEAERIGPRVVSVGVQTAGPIDVLFDAYEANHGADKAAFDELRRSVKALVS